MPCPEKNNYTNDFSIHRICRFLNFGAGHEAVIR